MTDCPENDENASFPNELLHCRYHNDVVQLEQSTSIEYQHEQQAVRRMLIPGLSNLRTFSNLIAEELVQISQGLIKRS